MGVSLGITRFFARSPGLKRGKERLHTGIGRVSVQLLRGEQAHEVFRFEPNAFVPHRAPEEDKYVAVEHPTLVSKLIELGASADVHPTHLIHQA